MLTLPKILIVGDQTVADIAAAQLGLDFEVVPFGDAIRRGRETVPLSTDTLARIVEEKGREYSAAIVDYRVREHATTLRDVGYEGPIVGLVSSSGDTILQAEPVIELSTQRPIIRETLVGLLVEE